jgi:hypothetical protein
MNRNFTTVFIGCLLGAAEPCLEAEKLGNRGEGRIGLFVGNNSGGDFADLKIIPAKTEK